MAASVTAILGALKQPKGGFLPLKDFDSKTYPDNLTVVGEYGIHPSLVGLAVDYGTRIALGDDVEKAFGIALVGAGMVGATKEAEELLAQIDPVALRSSNSDEQSIVALCKLSGFDSAFRAGAKAYKPVSEINPDAQTIADIGNLILRTKAFFDASAEAVIAGFTFEGAYTDDAGASDGDYICADTLWDLKVSKNEPTIKNTMQVLLYYLMGLRSNKDEFKAVTRIGLFNPWLQKSWSISVLDLDESFLSMVENDILGYTPRHARPSANWANEGSRTIYEVIDWIRDTCESERDKGDKFERASRYYLMNDPVYAQRFSDVWMWKDAPTNDGADLGIDLVAQDAEDGTYWAIQCKCYQKATLDLRDVATFYTKARATDDYAHNMIITTCEDFGPNLDKTATQYGTVRLFADSMAESDVDWDSFVEGKAVGKRSFKEPLPHQREAIDACLQKFQQHDRGQLIMACGTGKTITSLRLAEEMLPEGSLVLFLAPSISLVAQTMRVWANQSKRDLRCAVVCSDETASNAEGDTWESSLSDIPYPATTDPAALHKQIKRFDRTQGANVVFSTYQSIQVVSDAQRMGLDPFDLIVCDEAHRTTGASAASDDLTEQSAFTKVHDNRLVSAKKRVYMTATPKIYGDKARVQAKTESYEVSSMDDEEKFGPVFYRLSFGRAVDEGLLTDYRVIALTVSEDVVSEVYQRAMADEEGFEITDAAKVIGCWKGLADQGKKDGSGHPLKNAVAFCSTIPESKRISEYFERTVKAYIDYEREQGNNISGMECAVQHVDGTMDMANRKDKLAWLADTSEERCHILSNVRCLSEGVDVPNLDAIMFLQPKKSRVEVVQAVGRVMRRFEGKDYGYIILPVVIPAGYTPEEALDNTDAFKVVWEIVQALRSHDERLEGGVNSLQYDMATTSVVQVINIDKNKGKGQNSGSGTGGSADEDGQESTAGDPGQMKMDFSDRELQEAVNAVIVKKCGNKVYWEDWAKDIGDIAKRHIERVGELVLNGGPASAEFAVFLRGLRDSLNNGITEDEAVEMLAQHMITLPVFDALFSEAEFAKSNPVSIAMESMVTTLRGYGIETESEKRELAELYSSVRLRAEAIRSDAGKQKIIKELYEKFFSQAFKATSEKMGIVYTPNEVVNYILHATDRILRKEFGKCLADEHGAIHYHDIGDYLTREEKLSIVASSVESESFEWDEIMPDRHGDWINQRDDSWYEFAPMGLQKRKAPLGIFEIWSAGLKTQRDPWAWGFDGASVGCRMEGLVDAMNDEIITAKVEGRDIVYDAKKFSWTRRMEDFAKRGTPIDLGDRAVVCGMYRPFCKQWVYYNRTMNEMTYQQPRLFPLAASKGEKAERTYQQYGSFTPVGKGGVEMTYQQASSLMPNLVIQISGTAPEFSCLIANILPDLNAMKGGSQCFPLYWYEEKEGVGGLFAEGDVQKGGYVRHDAITDEALSVFRAAYPNAFGGSKGRTIEQAKADGLPAKIASTNERFEVAKIDIFYYIYGILHSPEYRERFAANLAKELPRIPLSRNFREFAGAGRALAKLHLGYEDVDLWPVKEAGGSLLPGPVKKMKWGKRKDPETGKKVDDHTVLIYNENLVIRDIPEAAQRYVVNGRSPLEWVIDRYQVKTDKSSGIVNDPNEYSDDPRYIVDLVEKLIRVSMETMEIVDLLPPVSELPQPANWPFAWKVGQ